MSARKPYPSDLTDLQWQNIHHLFPGGDRPPRSPGRPRTYDRKDVVDAVLYLARTGCQWRGLPHDFPPWKTVSYYFYTWRDAGVWEELNDVLRRDIRRILDREETPSAGVIDTRTSVSGRTPGPTPRTGRRTPSGTAAPGGVGPPGHVRAGERRAGGECPTGGGPAGPADPDPEPGRRPGVLEGVARGEGRGNNSGEVRKDGSSHPRKAAGDSTTPR